MNREIRFRVPKFKNNNEFKGFLYCGYQFNNKVLIKPKKTGKFLYYGKDEQYLGFESKGVSVFENDIVTINSQSFQHDEDEYFIINYDSDTCRYVLSGINIDLLYDFDLINHKEIEIVGNKHQEYFREILAME